MMLDENVQDSAVVKIDIAHSTRHDSMRLPDAHLRRTESRVRTVTQEEKWLISRALHRKEAERAPVTDDENYHELVEAGQTPGQRESYARDFIDRSTRDGRPPIEMTCVSGRSRREPRISIDRRVEDGRRIPPQYSLHRRKLGRLVRAQKHPPNPEYDGRQAITPSRQRFEIFCQTVSRDETSSEDAKISFFVKTAMEPYARKDQVLRSDTSTERFVPPKQKSFPQEDSIERPTYR
jgi:hypothetical protein